MRITESEKSDLKIKAAKSKVSMSEYAREQLTSTPSQKYFQTKLKVKSINSIDHVRFLNTAAFQQDVRTLDHVVSVLNSTLLTEDLKHFALHFRSDLLTNQINASEAVNNLLRYMTAKDLYQFSEYSEKLIGAHLSNKEQIDIRLHEVSSELLTAVKTIITDQRFINCLEYKEDKFTYDKDSIEEFRTDSIALNTHSLRSMWRTLNTESDFAAYFNANDRLIDLPNYKKDLLNKYAATQSIKAIDEKYIFSFLTKFKAYHYKS